MIIAFRCAVITLVLSGCTSIYDVLFNPDLTDTRYEMISLTDVNHYPYMPYTISYPDEYPRTHPNTFQIRIFFSSNFDFYKMRPDFLQFSIHFSLNYGEMKALRQRVREANGKLGQAELPDCSNPLDLDRHYYYVDLPISMFTRLRESLPRSLQYDLIAAPASISLQIILVDMWPGSTRSNVFTVPKEDVVRLLDQYRVRAD